MKKDFLIIADAPGDFELMYTENHTIVALDGVANRLAAILEKPHFVVGDMDSITQETIDSLHVQGTEFIEIKDQDSTDLDKGIEFCDSEGANSITILNSTGGRMDHTLVNVRMLKKHYNPDRPILLVSHDNMLEYVKDSQFEVNGTEGDQIAVMAFPEAIVTSDGLEYDMKNHKLEFAYSESTSNNLARDKATITIRGEALVIYSKNSVLKA